MFQLHFLSMKACYCLTELRVLPGMQTFSTEHNQFEKFDTGGVNIVNVLSLEQINTIYEYGIDLLQIKYLIHETKVS